MSERIMTLSVSFGNEAAVASQCSPMDCPR
jgi:hypothetical protein